MEREELLKAARAGDSGALTELLNVCQPELRRYAQRHCASGDVDDAVQDALWIVHQRFRALRFAVALSGWLFQVVRRICWHMNRKASRFLPLDDSVVSDRENVNTLHKRLDLRRVLSELDATHREVLLLRDFYGYSSEETAERLGISIEATKSRLHRARSNMRRALSIKSREDVRQ